MNDNLYNFKPRKIMPDYKRAIKIRIEDNQSGHLLEVTKKFEPLAEEPTIREGCHKGLSDMLDRIFQGNNFKCEGGEDND